MSVIIEINGPSYQTVRQIFAVEYISYSRETVTQLSCVTQFKNFTQVTFYDTKSLAQINFV